MGILVRQRMSVAKYIPTKLYGFVLDNLEREWFFHIRAFKWGGYPYRPPPIVGEPVDVEFDPERQTNGHAPKARVVYRIEEPKITCGVVEDFNETFGYGFIVTSDGRSHYLHRSEMVDQRIPLPGMEVSFFEGFKQGRLRACYITLLKKDGEL